MDYPEGLLIRGVQTLAREQFKPEVARVVNQEKYGTT
jgi:hypothetical protein